MIFDTIATTPWSASAALGQQGSLTASTYALEWQTFRPSPEISPHGLVEYTAVLPIRLALTVVSVDAGHPQQALEMKAGGIEEKWKT